MGFRAHFLSPRALCLQHILATTSSMKHANNPYNMPRKRRKNEQKKKKKRKCMGRGKIRQKRSASSSASVILQNILSWKGHMIIKFSSWVPKSKCVRALCKHFLNPSKLGAVTTLQGILFQCLTPPLIEEPFPDTQEKPEPALSQLHAISFSPVAVTREQRSVPSPLLSS